VIEKYFEGKDLSDWVKKSHGNFLPSNNKFMYIFNQLKTPKSFELFWIKKSQANNFELFIDYVSNSMTIGTPKRENHKIAELKAGNPLRYKINGKSDFTMTGRKQRAFYEFDYVFELYEQIEKIEYLDLNKISKIKTIPIEACKLINERKILK